MGILNATPDSFSDGGLFLRPDAAARHAERMVEDGADLIDVGGESTRPGSRPVPLAEELHRVIPVIERLAARVRVPISVDTSKAEVARLAIDAGASMVNDVTALRGDARMAGVVARAGVPVILMHMRGTPQAMQRRPRYRDVVEDVATFLEGAARRAQAAGIARERLLLDPGIGFGKALAHNLSLLRRLDRFVAMGYPVVIGPSRKSFIGQILGAPPEERLAGTLACIAFAAARGAAMVRVHDVKQVRQFLTIWQALDETGRQHRPRRHRAASAARRAA